MLDKLSKGVKAGVGKVKTHYSYEETLKREQRGLELDKLRTERARLSAVRRRHEPRENPFGGFGGGLSNNPFGSSIIGGGQKSRGPSRRRRVKVRVKPHKPRVKYRYRYVKERKERENPFEF
jgi:hypothetical protein